MWMEDQINIIIDTSNDSRYHIPIITIIHHHGGKGDGNHPMEYTDTERDIVDSRNIELMNNHRKHTITTTNIIIMTNTWPMNDLEMAIILVVIRDTLGGKEREEMDKG